jgi:hypothetical protein
MFALEEEEEEEVEEEEEEEMTEKKEGLGMDWMRRGHESRRMALPTLLDIMYKQDEMKIHC